MCLNEVLKRVMNDKYRTLKSYKADLYQIWKNCYLYNQDESVIFKFAQQLETKTHELLEQEGIRDIRNFNKLKTRIFREIPEADSCY